MSSNKETIARIGVATKGVIYTLIGVLTAYATLNAHKNVTSSKGVLKYLASQSFGQILLLIISLGIICYVAWRLYLALKFPEDEDNNDSKSIIKRIGYFISAMSYGLLAFSAIEILITQSGSGSSKQTWISLLLDQSWGVYVIYLIALGLAIKGAYELYRAYSGKFKNRITGAELDSNSETFLLVIGKIGFTARGIVFGVLAYLFFKAASRSNADMAGGTKTAFSFLYEQGGLIMLGVVALGLALYGVYLIASSRYRNIHIAD